MKKWLGVLGIVTMLAGCQDSTSDVATTTRGTDTPPDTIITKDDVTVEVYGPYHPRSLAQDAIQFAQSEVRGELDRLVEAGFVLAPAGPSYFVATAPDGRSAELTWFQLIGALGEVGGVIHVRTDTGDMVESFGPNTDKGDARPEDGKRDGEGPNRAFGFNTCLSMARTIFQACVGNCIQEGGSDRGCRQACLLPAISAFAYCLFVSS